MKREAYVHLVMLNEVVACERAGRSAKVSEGTGAITCPQCKASLYYAARASAEHWAARESRQIELNNDLLKPGTLERLEAAANTVEPERLVRT